ncbi:cell wall-binding repeat-containing protein [Priestia taiwanensis]|uniref:ArsR family transcriptional regulator n=1 Tax=Priestia taiwanensis TaxID=1347902 RepID=A0A917AJ41_9BACI|nr:cell wall-binding repeat-containing protein [Priestia taiwanensis]MBM7361784.1 hypothetical protein [Priestia taiwanensis]GGE56960.1 hypothetical protein GCM10007140_04110 [Priestia taiwanensis]
MTVKKWGIALSSASILLLAACTNETSDHSKHQPTTKETTEQEATTKVHKEMPKSFNENATNGLLTMNMKNSTRLNEQDPVKMAVLTSQMIWPATHTDNQPNAVILAPKGNWQLALASADLIHHPSNGPILFLEDKKIPETTLQEIKRLSPTGIKDGTNIIVIGELDESAKTQLASYKVKQLKETDAAKLAKEVDALYAEITGDYPTSVIIGSSDNDAQLFSVPAANWIAHMPEPILYVSKDTVPEATIDALKERKGKAIIYVLGPEKIISKEVENQLGEHGKVVRISGETPTANSVAFATFKDKDTGFGWGMTEPGHGVSFTSSTTPSLAIAGAPFSHMGKHAPVIILDKGEVTKDAFDFLVKIKPTFKDDPTTGPYNHAFILGADASISYKSQGILDDALEIVQEDGKGHEGH